MDSVQDIFHRYILSYDSGDGTQLKSFLHPSHLYYPPGGADPMDLTERVADEKFFFSAFSDIETTVKDEIISGNKVAARIVMKCTQTGEYQGIAATGRRITITYMEIISFKEGLIADEWAEFDMMGILRQLQN